MASLTLRQVGKTYSNHTEAVKNVSLSVEDGDFVLLTGEPGCGKSTLDYNLFIISLSVLY